MTITNSLRFTSRLAGLLACVLAAGHGLGQASAAPRFDGVSPARINVGATGATVTLAVDSFAAGDKVFINGAEATVQTSAASAVTVVVPDGLTATAGALEFRVGADMATASGSRTVFVVNPASVNSAPAAIVNAAAYTAGMASNSIAAIFGTQLATGTEFATDTDPVAAGVQLPTSLAGTSVYINGLAADLLYVGAGQINFIVPDGLAEVPTEVLVRASDGTFSVAANVQVRNVSPGVFTITQTGAGLPIALTTFGTTYQPVWREDLTPQPVDAGAADRRNYLVLFGTGWRGRTGLGNVSVTIGGIAAQVEFAGEQGAFVGLDQMNVVIPPSLTSGPADVVVTVDGRSANTTSITIQ